MHVHAQEAPRSESTLMSFAFHALLQWLDDGVDSHGERYIEMRRRLVSSFDRRNRPAADELADETLSRVARTLQEAGTIATTPPARYCYVTARFVLLEDVRRERRELRLRSGVAAAARAARLDRARRRANDPRGAPRGARALPAKVAAGATGVGRRLLPQCATAGDRPPPPHGGAVGHFEKCAWHPRPSHSGGADDVCEGRDRRLRLPPVSRRPKGIGPRRPIEGEAPRESRRH